MKYIFFLFLAYCKSTSKSEEPTDYFEQSEAKPFDPKKTIKEYSTNFLRIKGSNLVVKVLPSSSNKVEITPPQNFGCYFDIKQRKNTLEIESYSEVATQLQNCELLIKTKNFLNYDISLSKESSFDIQISSKTIIFDISGKVKIASAEKIQGNLLNGSLEILQVNSGTLTQYEGASILKLRNLKKEFYFKLIKGSSSLDIDQRSIFYTNKKKNPPVYFLKLENQKGNISFQ
jgi:hypothetical protein